MSTDLDGRELLERHGIPVKSRYTVKEISLHLGVDEKTVYGWHYTGKYEGLKIGGGRYYSVSAVISILRDSTAV